MRKYIRALAHLGTTSSLLLTLTTCRGSDGYQEPLAPDGRPSSPSIALSPATFHLQEGDTLSLQVKAGDLAVPTSQIHWTVEPSSAARIEHGRVLYAVDQASPVTVTAHVGASTATTTGSISAVPVELQQVGSPASAGVVGRTLSDSLTVLVLGDSGEKVVGVPVAFEVVRGGGTLSHSERASGPDGIARSAWTLGATPGPQAVRASVEGLEPVEFSVEVLPDFSSATAHAVQGADQAAVAGELLPTPLMLLVSDSLGNPLSGMEVTWSFSSGEGYEAGASSAQAASPLVLVTDEGGRSSVRWQLGTEAGPQSASAQLSSTPAAGTDGASQTDDLPVAVVFEAAVSAGPPAVLDLTPEAASIEVGSSLAFEVSAADEFGNPIDDVAVTWTSSDPSVATIDADGVLTAHAEGTVSVRAAAGEVEEVATVDVVSATGFQGLTLVSGNGQTAAVGTTLPQALRVQVTTIGGEPAQGTPVTWSVSIGGGSVSPASSTTDADGYAEATLSLGTQVGTHLVRAAVSGLGSVDFTATAVPGPIAEVLVAPSSAFVQVGAKKQFMATAEDKFGNPVSGAAVAWSSSTPGVASVDADGLATGVAAGTTRIEAAAGGFTAAAALTVTTNSPPSQEADPGAVADLGLISVTESSATLRWTQVDDGTGNPAHYALRYGTPEISWGSAHPTEVSVPGTSVGASLQYTFQGLQPGTSYQFRLVAYRGTLDVDAVFGPVSNTASGSTTVGGSQRQGVTVMPASVSLVGIGSNTQLSAAATDASGAPVQSPSFTWRSLNPQVATVSPSGVVTATAVGTTAVVVAAACCGSDTAEVAVSQVASSVVVAPSSLGLAPGATGQLTATVKDQSGSIISGAIVSWRSSNTAVATVTAAGIITALAGGHAVISAMSGGKAGSAVVTVSGASPPPVEGLLFSDDFESTDLSKRENGFRWREQGAHVFPFAKARSGKYALRFRYGPDTLGAMSNRQHNFVMTANEGSGYTEFWMEYWMYVPDNYVHRQQRRFVDGAWKNGATNNKFFAAYGEKYNNPGGEVHVVVEYHRGSDTESHANISSAFADPCEDRKPFRSQTAAGDVFSTGMAGTWQRFRIHMKSAYRASVVDIWRGSELIASLPADYSITCPGWTGVHDYFRKGYIMGWANSGFTEQTDFWLDDFKVWTSDPGWGR